MRFQLLILVFLFPGLVFALGNHPEASVCTEEKPYQAICTHSLHSLEGWYGQCFATEEEAQKEANEHVAKEHNGNSRWTGIRKAKFKGSAGY